MAKRRAAYTIRKSTPADLKLIIAQRRAMFEDIGFDDRRRMSAMLLGFKRTQEMRLQFRK